MRPTDSVEELQNQSINSESETPVDSTEQASVTEKLEKFERCPYCSSKLLFTHDLNLSHLKVTETSRCAGCGVTMRPKVHTLH